MSDLIKIKERALPEWRLDNKGRQRLNGRWNRPRMAEFLIEHPVWQTIDDLARIVFSTTSPTLRDKIRKCIPRQRQYMLHQLEQPLITQYGHGGRIERIKLYVATEEHDRMLLRIELDHQRDRKELTEQRYENLLRIFLLETKPSEASQ